MAAGAAIGLIIANNNGWDRGSTTFLGAAIGAGAGYGLSYLRPPKIDLNPAINDLTAFVNNIYYGIGNLVGPDIYTYVSRRMAFDGSNNLDIRAVLPTYESIMPETYNHIKKAITTRGKPMVLSKGDPSMTYLRRYLAQKGNKLPHPYGKWLDEYPFASTNEGGEGASLEFVDAWEQVIQGTQISLLHRKLEIGDHYLVFPINKKRFRYKEAPAYLIRDIKNPQQFVPGREYIMQPTWLNQKLIDWKSERYKTPSIMPPVFGPTLVPAL